jgi:class 3 adenylate cyclase
MQQIADWLEKLGMSEYAQRFAENRIDVSVLPDLTDQDLEKLGVLLGDRRKMLRAIANLEAVDAPIAVVTTAPATPRSVDTAERRQVTVMFSDLVGSTALSARWGDCAALRRLRCEIHGRRGPLVFRVSAGSRR